MRRFIALVGFIALMAAACGGALPSPSREATRPSGATTTAPVPSTAASPSSSAAAVTAQVTFDGQECGYVGPATVPDGTKLVFVFENTPAAVADSTTKDATSIGSDLVVIEAIAGTTWDSIEASLPAPAGTKGTWPTPAWAADLATYGSGPRATVMTKATGAAYYVGCHQYWGRGYGTTYASYPATLIRVLKG
jgi:hypothetical protein